MLKWRLQEIISQASELKKSDVEGFTLGWFKSKGLDLDDLNLII